MGNLTAIVNRISLKDIEKELIIKVNIKKTNSMEKENGERYHLIQIILNWENLKRMFLRMEHKEVMIGLGNIWI